MNRSTVLTLFALAVMVFAGCPQADLADQAGEPGETAESGLPSPGDSSPEQPGVAEQVEFEFEVTVVGEGTVSPESGSYPDGTVLELYAEPLEGWQFDHWEGGVSGTEPGAVLTLTEDIGVTAVFVEIPPDMVWLDGFSFGDGLILVDPLGEPASPSGFYYPRGSTVTLTAMPNSGWFFLAWGGDVEDLEPVLSVMLDSDTLVLALFEQLAPPPPPVYIGAVLVGADGMFLGNVNTNAFDPDSLANPWGAYGSAYASLSIWNPYGLYGGTYSSWSAYNPYAMTPPAIFIGGQFHAYVTKNAYIMGLWIDPDVLAMELGRFDVIR